MSVFNYGVDRLDIDTAIAITKGKIAGRLNQNATEKIQISFQSVQNVAQSDHVVYGINSGFGPLCTTKIPRDETIKLQYNILKSHSVGVGHPIPDDVTKLMLITKVHALSQGFSGVALETVERIMWHIDHDVIPLVPSQGSVGASGDLAPLSHLFLPLIGLGRVKVKGAIMSAEDMLMKFGKKPIQLHPKEGLALINGTQFMLAYGVKVTNFLRSNLIHADLIGAMMLDALKGSLTPFGEALHRLRPYRGSQKVARRISGLLQDSEINVSHTDCERVQDPYSLRCMPQIHGASWNTFYHLQEIINIELNSVTDNPIILHEDEIVSGGHFHGQPIALPLDYSSLAASEIGNVSDRRIYLALSGKYDVPTLLLPEIGVNSGFMILQYTSAALVSENKSLCFPASADSIPTSLGQEDHVSMGSISGRKALRINRNVEKILAIELICAAQALDFHRPLRSSPFVESMHEVLREYIPFVKEDTSMADYIMDAIELLERNELVEMYKNEYPETL